MMPAQRSNEPRQRKQRRSFHASSLLGLWDAPFPTPHETNEGSLVLFWRAGRSCTDLLCCWLTGSLAQEKYTSTGKPAPPGPSPGFATRFSSLPAWPREEAGI